MNCNTIYCSNVIMGAIKTLENCGCYRLIICCNATATSNLPVNIQVNGVNIDMLCRAGNTLYANQLEKRKSYSIMYGNQNENYANGVFVVQDRVCPRASQIPSATPTSL